MMVWSAITTGKGLGREEITGLFAKSRFNRKYSTFSWCEEDLAVPDVPFDIVRNDIYYIIQLYINYLKRVCKKIPTSIA